jgi:putative transposase
MVNVDGNLWRWYHNVSECNYHIQLTIKYRRAVLEPKVVDTIKNVLKEFKEQFAINIHDIGFDENHIHILCQFLPKYSGGDVIRYIKTFTAKACLKLEEVQEQLWENEFWTDGYYIGTVSNRGNRKTIEEYIRKQGRKPEDVQLKLFSLE